MNHPVDIWNKWKLEGKFNGIEDMKTFTSSMVGVIEAIDSENVAALMIGLKMVYNFQSTITPQSQRLKFIIEYAKKVNFPIEKYFEILNIPCNIFN